VVDGTEERPSVDDPARGPDPGRRRVAKRRYDPGRPVEFAATIVDAVADALGVDPLAMTRPLSDVLDATAVAPTVLWGPGTPGRAGPGRCSLEFRYADRLVPVYSGGWVRVCERRGVDPPE
jgi:hypothetical protein